MNSPDITIFIPTYKRPQKLKRAIESAAAQTWENIQIVICDNASNDETVDVVSEFKQADSRIKYFCHPSNIGMLANYEFAISILDTEFYSFLSDDDLLLPCFCETAINGFFQFPDISFFACSTIIASKEKGVLRVPLDLWPREGRFLPAEGLPIMVDKYPVPTTTLFRKTAQIDFKNQTAWDCDFLIQLAGRFPFAISKKPCGIMINHSNSFTSEKSYEETLQSIRRLIERTKGFQWMDGKLKASTLCSLQKHFNRMLFDSIISHLLNHRTQKAKKNSYELLRINPLKLKSMAGFAVALISSALPFACFFIIFLKKIRDSKRNHKFNKTGLNKYIQYLSNEAH